MAIILTMRNFMRCWHINTIQRNFFPNSKMCHFTLVNYVSMRGQGIEMLLLDACLRKTLERFWSWRLVNMRHLYSNIEYCSSIKNDIVKENLFDLKEQNIDTIQDVKSTDGESVADDNVKYFKQIVNLTNNPDTHINVSNTFSSEVSVNEKNDDMMDHHRDVIGVNNVQLTETTKPRKREIDEVYNLASLVNHSITLEELMRLGVDLSEVEKIAGAASLLIRLDIVRDVQPILFFLRSVGIEDSAFGACITKNPLMLGESVDKLRSIVGYFESKKFTKDMITCIIKKIPQVLTMNIMEIDKVLGQYQKLFRLTGAEIRHVIPRLPKLIIWPPAKVKDVRLYMGEFLGFSDVELKQILIACPKVYLSNKYQLGVRFDYIHNTMGVPHPQIVHWPGALRTRPYIIKQRHLYLVHLSRAQYDPRRENYVSLRALVSGRDRDFCRNVAKTPVSTMDAFLKSL